MLHGGIQIQTTRLGLFDDQMKCVSWIYLYDSWLSTVRGYLNTAYYPESGGAHYQSSGDIYSSFDRTAAVWYDRNSNSILSAIDGNVVTLAPAYNASRIISYLVIQTQRYDDKTLLDMRVHEINVLANVRATLPWVPEIPPDEEPPPGTDDGSLSGLADGASETQNVDLKLTASLGSMRIIWVLISFWPALSFEVLGLDENLQPTTLLPPLLSFAVDLLSYITVAAMTIVDFAFALAGMDPGVLVAWIMVEIAKDFSVVATFASLYIAAYAAFRAADGFRIAQAYPAMGAAIVAGVILFAAALGLVEGFNMVGRVAGMEDFWSLMFFLVIWLTVLSSCLKGFPDNPVMNAIIAKGDNLVYWIYVKIGIDLLAVVDWNPVISYITCTFMFLTCVYFWFRFLNYVQIVLLG